ncbi:hypothetical protein MNBD_GAMMA18-250 [hydrothermal vent metagenome]|uniref:Uncharacterized protein n=1 Tax=hydrothermal vent metagenome TaxID=652676 RepID=A0A3B0ZTX4_9ZZZZ
MYPKLYALLMVVMLLPVTATAAVIGPIKKSGSIGFLTQYNKAVSGAASTSQSYVFRGGADSYIWQPWFIVWSGSLGLTLSDSAQGSSRESSSRSISGAISFDVLPRSRFPLRLSYSVTNSRSESQINSGASVTAGISSERESRSESFSAYQTYSSPGGTYFSGWLTSNTSEAPAVKGGATRAWGKNTSSGLSVARRFEFHSVEMTLGEYNSRSIGSNALRRTASLSHNYSPESEFGVSSGVVVNDRETKSSGRVGQSDSSVRFDSRFFWRPNYSDFSVNGSIAAGEESKFSGGSSRSVSAQMSGGYRLSRTVRVTAGVSVNLDESDARKSGGSGQNVGLSYTSDRVLLGKFTWGWNLGGGLSNNLSRGGGSEQSSASANISLGHSANRQIVLSERAAISLSLNQSGGVSQIISSSGTESDDSSLGSERDRQENLSHAASIKYRHSAQSGVTSIWSSLNDNRNFNSGSSRQGFQVSLSREERVSRTSGLSGSLNYNYSQSSTPGSGRSSNSTSSGSMNYRDSRFLGVHRLMLQSQIRLSEASSANAGLSLVSSWSNQITYQLGLLSASLTASYAHRTGRSGVDQRYMFSVTRTL